MITHTEDEGTLLDYAMAIAHERELNVLGHHHDSDGAVLRFRSAVRRALLATGGQAQAVQAAAVPEAIEQMAADRYKVVPSHESVFHRWAVVADNGEQQLYIGREGECQNMARKFMGAFLDGAFVAMQNAAPAHPAEGVPAQAVQDAERWMGIGRAIERASADLPEETEIIVSLEKGAGTVTLIDQDGNEHENFSTDYGFAGVLNEAIDAAIAAQAKQGEE